MKNKTTLSVVLATRNESANIKRCLDSVKGIADEIVVVDEYSDDDTAVLAKKSGAKVYLEKHHDIFHITKQIALEKATKDWILQMDADEVITEPLAQEIIKTINMTPEEMRNRKVSGGRKWRLFRKHQAIIENRDGSIGQKTGEVVGLFIARRNMFMGKPLVHAGVYPDGVIRLVKRGKATFPQKSVHEQIRLTGEVSWLENSMDHYDSPTFERYLNRANRYTDLTAKEYKSKSVGKNMISFLWYVLIKPTFVFVNLYFRHLGFLDREVGFIWSFYSALHFPLAYFKYITEYK